MGAWAWLRGGGDMRVSCGRLAAVPLAVLRYY
jgi:hypothetical protein